MVRQRARGRQRASWKRKKVNLFPEKYVYVECKVLKWKLFFRFLLCLLWNDYYLLIEINFFLLPTVCHCFSFLFRGKRQPKPTDTDTHWTVTYLSHEMQTMNSRKIENRWLTHFPQQKRLHFKALFFKYRIGELLSNRTSVLDEVFTTTISFCELWSNSTEGFSTWLTL